MTFISHQVIDTKAEVIKHTPKAGEHIVRSVLGDNGEVVNQTFTIPGLDSNNTNTVMLKSGDRIVNENNKIKLRVNQEADGQIQVRLYIVLIYVCKSVSL